MDQLSMFFLSLADNVVLLLVVMPFVGALLVRLMQRSGPEPAYYTALTNIWLSVCLALLMFFRFEQVSDAESFGHPQMLSSLSWVAGTGAASTADENSSIESPLIHAVPRFSGPNIQFSLGVNAFSLWPILLTVGAAVAAVQGGRERLGCDGISRVLFAQGALIGTLAAQDVVLLAAFSQVSVLSLFLLIGNHGDRNRRIAARRFFRIHTVSTLLLMTGLIGAAVSYWWVRIVPDQPTPRLRFSLNLIVEELPRLTEMTDETLDFWNAVSPWLFVLICAGVVLRIPLPPFHHWWLRTCESCDRRILPLLICGFLSTGPYLALRILPTLFPDLLAEMGSRLLSWSIVAALLIALSTLAINERKRFLATAALVPLATAFGAVALNDLAAARGAMLVAVGVCGSLALNVLLHRGPGWDAAELFSETGTRYAVDLRRVATLLARAGLFGCPISATFWGELLILQSVFRRSSSGGVMLVIAFFIVIVASRSAFRSSDSRARTSSRELSEQSISVPAMIPLIVIVAALAIAPHLVAGPVSNSSGSMTATEGESRRASLE